MYRVVPLFSGPPDEWTPPACWHSLSMYGLFCHVNVPLMRGHPVDMDRIMGHLPACRDH